MIRKRHNKVRYKNFCEAIQHIGKLGGIEFHDPNPDNKIYIVELMDEALKLLSEGYFVGNL